MKHASLSYLCFFMFLVNSSISTKEKSCELKFIEKFLVEDHISIVIGYGINSVQIINEVCSLQFPKVIHKFEEGTKVTLVHSKSYLLIENNTTTLRKALVALDVQTLWNTRAKHLLLFTQDVNEEEIKKSLLLLWKYNIYNVVVTANGSFYTWYPYDMANKCGTKAQLKKFNPCQQLKSFSPYEDKIPTDLKGCPMKICWSQYIIYSRDPHNSSPGFLFYLAFVIREKWNVTLLIRHDNTFLKFFLSQATEQDAIESMKKYNIDVALTPLQIQANVHEDVDLSWPFLDTSAMWWLPLRRKLEISSAEIFPFPGTTWLAIGAAFVVSIIAFFSFLKRAFKETFWATLQSSVIMAFQLLLNSSVASTKLLKNTRIILMFSLIYSLHLNCFYLASLSYLFTTPRYVNKMETKEDLLETNVKLKSTERFRNYMQMAEGAVWKELGNKVETINNLQLLISDYAENPDHAIALPITELNFIENPDQVEIAREKVSHTYLAIPIRKRYVLYDRINLLIHRTLDHGLTNKWLFESTRKIPKVNMRTDNAQLPFKLRIRNLQCVFWIHACGMVVSFLVFVVEVYLASKRLLTVTE